MNYTDTKKNSSRKLFKNTKNHLKTMKKLSTYRYMFT